MSKRKKEIIRVAIGAALFVAAVITDALASPALEPLQSALPYPFIMLAIFLVPYLVLGYPVLAKAARNIKAGHIFDENFLMCVATIGALCLAEFPEAVAVMLFYQIGDLFEDYAVNKSRDSISEMMDICPEQAFIERDGEIESVNPDEVEVGTVIVVRPGERVPLDGIIVEGETELDTAALTGESFPRNVFTGDTIASGSINLSSTIYVKTTKEFDDSTVSRILELVEDAASEKAPMENFITRFARYYTPIVCLLALVIAIVPPFFTNFEWTDWIQRALVFLVVSCPCALVISVPLSFFGGIGGASKKGILIKGSNYLEALSKVKTILFDKTGTITKGTFSVSRISPVGISSEELLRIAAMAEAYSNHPIALSIRKEHEAPLDLDLVSETTEIAGQGIRCIIDGQVVLAGNARLMEANGIDAAMNDTKTTVLHVAVDEVYRGSIEVEDTIKDDSVSALQRIKELGVQRTVILTGDREEVAAHIAKVAGLDEYHAGLLPEGKIDFLRSYLEAAKNGEKVAFVGDGINDAPALIRSDVGIAMGAMGSDAAIEAADVVFMDDKLSRLADGVNISRKTVRIVYQNIIFALGVKLLVLVLAAFGLANMWEAIFADVGVSVIAILNAMRTLKVK
ncbi:heavy metal translocating P-type ATPase [Anaerotardibacter muris]|uniref:heavy metal translocating P-type ATPase n=1 Tax=Anaerotardibacter muris TaxID=2941505 RepID=UPI00203CFC74|nr:heavy metal translocating P-type ATPase [Anaerotardibacter muris]